MIPVQSGSHDRALRRRPWIGSPAARHAWLKRAALFASLLPLAFDAWAFAAHDLGRDPYRFVIRDTGVWSLWFLCFTLILTPVRRFTGWQGLAAFRRMLGLMAFFYGALHTLAYVVFDRLAGLLMTDGRMSWSTVAALTSSTAIDVWEKPFLLIGVVALVGMVPLAVTSASAVSRRLGGPRWRRLHRLVYPVAILSLLHHWWPFPDRVRVDAYAILLGAALAARLIWVVRHRRPQGAAQHV